MQKKPTSIVLYKLLFPNPTSKDPRDFDDFVARCIVPEIRCEIISWFGFVPDERDLETSYPGWDYTSRDVRMRLGRYAAHRRLFRAFEKADLSEVEIDKVATWFGNKHERMMRVREWGDSARELSDRGDLESEYEDYSDDYSA
ncbi:hypothetical protein DFP73DRAFT_478573 [Morchella snyderi]|nr:hypothetical protein DFP73DRAFT_478573 [Morchella snyderi]